MKINIVPSNKLALLSAAVFAAMLAFSHNASANRIAGGLNIPNTPATTMAFNDTNDLGQVLSGIPSGDAQRTAYTNHLIDMALGTTDVALGQTFHRSLANPGPGFPNYPDAVFSHNGTPGSNIVDLGNGTLYSYLFAKYDGPNGGSEVWYVGGLSGIITIPTNGLFGQHYGLSGWTLFGPGGGGQVPDGGTTVMLLGAALGALGVARRYLMS